MPAQKGFSFSGSTGSGGGVTSVAATDVSIVVTGTATAPTIATGTLDVIATQHPPAAAVAMNAKKITGLANGSGAQDAAAFGQIPTAFPQSGVTVTGTAANRSVIQASSSSAGAWVSLATAGIADKSSGSQQSFTSYVKALGIGINTNPSAPGGNIDMTGAIGIAIAAPIVAGTTATAPPTSATIQTALGNLALGTAFQNTLSYDVRLTVYLSVTVNTSGVISLGVGTTNTPVQSTIVSGVTTVGFVPVTFKIPAGQYALLSISGTVTDSIAGQYLEAA